MNYARTFAFALIAPFVAGCATKGFVRQEIATTRTQSRAYTDSSVTSERQARMASDSAITSDVVALRRDLDSLRTEFGAKITALETGLQFDMPVHFAFDDATVQDSDREALDRFSKVVQKYYPNATITVEGFADPAGTKTYNKQLSQRRADAVKAYLTSNGLTGDVRTVGYGETRQVVQGAEKDQPGAELNRRVVFVIESAQAAPASGIASTQTPD